LIPYFFRTGKALHKAFAKFAFTSSDTDGKTTAIFRLIDIAAKDLDKDDLLIDDPNVYLFTVRIFQNISLIHRLDLPIGVELNDDTMVPLDPPAKRTRTSARETVVVDKATRIMPCFQRFDLVPCTAPGNCDKLNPRGARFCQKCVHPQEQKLVCVSCEITVEYANDATNCYMCGGIYTLGHLEQSNDIRINDDDTEEASIQMSIRAIDAVHEKAIN
jgi:hypothetical protein